MRTRGLVIALPVILTVLIAVAVGALVLVQNQRQSAQVAEADRVAQAYLAEIASFRSTVVDRVNESDEADPGALGRIVRRAIAKPPRLGSAPAYGREHSTAYAEAVQVRETVLRPYRRLAATLRRADGALEFIEAAREVLELRATDYVGAGLITSSAPVRGSLIPAFVKARDEFARVPVPQGQEELAATVRGAAQYVIDQATVLADRIESRQSFSFTYQEQFQAAADALNDYSTVVKGDVSEAVAAVTAES